MALEAAVVSTTQPAANGTVSITGLSFAPKVLVLTWSHRTADGGGADYATGYGFASNVSGGTTQGAMWGVSRDGLTDTDGQCRLTNADCVTLINPAGTVLGEADVSAWNADGVTLNWTGCDGTQRLVNVLCLGGADITGAKVGATQRPTATGNQTVTVGDFEPDAVLFLSASDRLTTMPGNDANASTGFHVGWCDGTSQGVSGWGSRDGRATGDSASHQRTDRCLAAGWSSISCLASFVSFDATSGGRFTVNWDTVDIRGGYFLWLALAGTDLQFKAGSFNTDTDLGAQAVTGVGFEPQALLVNSWGRAASTSMQTGGRNSFGLAAGATQRAVVWGGGTSGSATTEERGYLDRDELLLLLTPGSGTQTLDGSADLTSFDSDGFTLDWGDASPGAYQAVYFAVRGAAAAPPGGNRRRRVLLLARG